VLRLETKRVSLRGTQGGIRRFRTFELFPSLDGWSRGFTLDKAKELLTESELLTICHRQGFADADEVQSAILEPGGTFFLKGKSPSDEDTFRKEVLSRLEKIETAVSN